jgi:chorismate dehydratase
MIVSGLRLGQVEYLNCLPVYYAIENGLIPFNGNLIKGTPAMLNRLFLDGELDVTPISSIEYARNPEKCIILPDMSISSNGRVASILFFSKVPITELEGKKVYVTTSSATSVALLKILFEHYYHVDVELCPALPNLVSMLEDGEGALLIGDDAMLAHRKVINEGWKILVTDLGEAWKEFTGERMVYALWVIRSGIALERPDRVEELVLTLQQAKKISMAEPALLLNEAHRLTGLSCPVLEDYFNIIRHGLSPAYRRGLLSFYDYAYKSGLIEERLSLSVWGEQDD